MEAAHSSETSVNFYRTARLQISKYIFFVSAVRTITLVWWIRNVRYHIDKICRWPHSSELSRYSSSVSASRFWIRFPAGAEIFFPSSRLALGLIRCPIQWLPGGLSPGRSVKLTHSPPSGAAVKNGWSYTAVSLTNLRFKYCGILIRDTI
jgi:hypothetical protein